MKRTGIIIGGAVAFGLFLAPNALAAGITQGTPVGTVSAEGDPATQTGHIIVDGNGAQGAPEGYVGVDSNEGVVGCWTGNYSSTGGNNVITEIPPTVPPAAPNPDSPCAPSP